MLSVAAYGTWPVGELAAAAWYAAVMRCLNLPKKQTSNGCRSQVARAGIINSWILCFSPALH
eukprot:12584635-Prorocentrum_lima.AAC.1